MAYDLAMELDRLERDAELVLLCPSTSSDEEEEDVGSGRGVDTRYIKD